MLVQNHQKLIIHQADEAQRGGRYDGYSDYRDNYGNSPAPSTVPNPFDSPAYTQPHDDPFLHPSEPMHPGMYQAPAPVAERYGSPNMIQHNPSPHPVNYPGVHYHPDAGTPPTGPPAPLNVPQYPPYQLADRSPVLNTNDDLGDMPLLQRGPSGYSDDRATTPGFPGGFAGGFDPTMGDEPESNIRYGRIPQRVPRRYRTIKKVECVMCLLFVISLLKDESPGFSMEILSSMPQSQRSSSICAQIAMTGNSRTCGTPQPLVIQTTSKMKVLHCVKYTTIHLAGPSCSL